MRSRLSLVLAALFGLVWLVQANDRSDPNSRTISVKDLVKQLAEQDFNKRDGAALALEACGPAILKDLLLLRDKSEPETRHRLDQIIDSMETRLLLEPKRVSLHLVHQPIQLALDEMARQTGYKIQQIGSLDDQQTLDLECDNEPFWKAFDQVCRAGGLILQPSYGNNALHVVAQDRYVPHISLDGAFRVVPASLSWCRDVDLSSLPRKGPVSLPSDNLTLSLNIQAEPKLPMIGLGEVQLESVYDNNNLSMVPLAEAPGPGERQVGPGRRGTHYFSGYPNLQQQTQIALVRPSEKSTRIKQLKAILPVTLLTDRKMQMVFDKLTEAKDKKNTVASLSFTVQEVSQTPAHQWQVKLLITNENKDNPNDYSWMNTLYSRLQVEDDQGGKFQVSHSKWLSGGTGSANLQFTFNPPAVAKVGPPAKLLYETWKTRAHLIHIEFKDVPLP